MRRYRAIQFFKTVNANNLMINIREFSFVNKSNNSSRKMDKLSF